MSPPRPRLLALILLLIAVSIAMLRNGLAEWGEAVLPLQFVTQGANIAGGAAGLLAAIAVWMRSRLAPTLVGLWVLAIVLAAAAAPPAYAPEDTEPWQALLVALLLGMLLSPLVWVVRRWTEAGGDEGTRGPVAVSVD